MNLNVNCEILEVIWLKKFLKLIYAISKSINVIKTLYGNVNQIKIGKTDIQHVKKNKDLSYF